MGTNRSSIRTVLLPVARMPEVNHTSSTSTSARGTTRNQVVNTGSAWTACTMTQSAWAMPVAHSHRPVNRKPPASAVIEPVGANGAGASAIGPSAKISARAPAGNFDSSQPCSIRNDRVQRRGRAPVGHDPGALGQRLQAEATAAERRGHERLEQSGVTHLVEGGIGQPTEHLGLGGPRLQAGNQALATPDELRAVKSRWHGRHSTARPAAPPSSGDSTSPNGGSNDPGAGPR